MVSFNEDTINPNATQVYYQDPDDLRKDHDDVIVHDDENDMGFEYSHDPISDALARAKANPSTVSIAKVGDKYYVNHDDLKVFMDACGENNYDCAVNHIVDAHSESTDITNDNICVVVNKESINSIDEETKELMERSDVEFEFHCSSNSKENFFN